MKKHKLILLFLLIYSINCYSIEKKEYENFLIARERINTSADIINIYELDDDYSLGLILRTKDEPEIIISNGKKLSAEPV